MNLPERSQKGNLQEFFSILWNQLKQKFLKKNTQKFAPTKG